MESYWKGLTSNEAIKLHALHVSNTLAQSRQPSDLSFLIGQLKSPLIIILLVAALVTFFLHDFVDTTIILAAVFLNTILGFIQERKAHRSLAALGRMLTPRASVLRDGTWQTINAAGLVPGDMVRAAGGDKIPADGEIGESIACFINEAMLTGESVPVEKYVGELIFSGTTVTGGRAIFRVTATGMRTRLGSIAATLEETTQEETPLERQLSKLSRILAAIVLLVSSVVFLVGWAGGKDALVMFTTAVAVAVSAIPEGMVVSLTVILAVGMQRILKQKALVRRLVAAETLGSVTTLCVDKTGTLTEGVMRVVAHKFTDEKHAICAAVLANNLADPIEAALWEWAQGQDHIDPQAITESQARIGEIPFDGTRKYMAVATASGLWLKGAPEVVIAKSALTLREKTAWIRKVDEYATQGLRVLALAHKNIASTDLWEKHLDSMEFLGIIGVSDPVRESVRDAITACGDAGIAVKVITGDYRATAEAVLAKLGMPIGNAAEEIMEGRELAKISGEDLARRVRRVRLFCRVTPEQKLNIVTALQQNGEVVGMTGDGVNDALALKKADIGIVVAGATDVARETADMVLLDSNFATIVAAIEEGRVVFHNIQKVVIYLLSDTFTEILLIVGSLLLQLPLPLTAAQILWINILNDGLPNAALALEPKEGDILKEPPRQREMPIVSVSGKLLIGVVSTFKAGIALAVFITMLSLTGDLATSQTATFAMIAVASFFYVFSLRHFRTSIIHSHPLRNPWLLVAVGVGTVLLLGAVYAPFGHILLGTRPLTAGTWMLVAGAAGVLLFVVELYKGVIRKKHLVARGSIL